MALALATAAAILAAKPTPKMFWIGLPFVVVGELIRVWSAGYLVKLYKLVTAGPFALCRNPQYVGSFLISTGYLLMCNRLWIWLCGIALFWLFHCGAVAYEEKLLMGRYGQEYARYCESVPRFIPRLRSLKGKGVFSVRQVCENNEYGRVLGAAVMSVLFGLMAYLPFIAPLELLAERL